MGRTQNRRLTQWIEASSFHLLLLLAVAMISWLSQHYNQVWDWTESGRNSLHPVSKALVGRLDAPLKIISFAPENAVLRDKIRNVLERYQRIQPHIEIEFINPAMQPTLTRELGIQVAGELHMSYKGRSEKLRILDEQNISNAIQRLLQQDERWIVAIAGHGERNIDGQANHDIGSFGAELARKGYQLQTLELAEQLEVPGNTAVLVIASPQSRYLPGELEVIKHYLSSGGNLLWLLEPDQTQGFESLAELLGINVLPGTVVDPNAADLGLDNPAITVAPRYPAHPVVASFEIVTIYPYAAALSVTPKNDWQAEAVITTLPRTWNETTPIKGEVSRNADEGELPGPLTLGYSLSREINGHQQRVMVIGDGDFLSNTYVGNGGNLDLGVNLLRWLSSDDQLLDIPAKVAPDLQLQLSNAQGAMIGFGFLLILPIGLFAAGGIIWWRRRRL